jgi:hypothetical protein
MWAQGFEMREDLTFGLLIVAVGENREHRRDAYDTLGSVTFEAAIDKRQKGFPTIKAWSSALRTSTAAPSRQAADNPIRAS